MRPKFLLTENLNRLAKWLRLLGYDADLYRSISFNNIKRIAARERRKILTRAQKQTSGANKDIILIRSEDHLAQLQEIRDLVSYNENMFFSRCLICNKILYEIDRQNIKEMVPEYVYNAYKNFKICRKCGRIYWPGTHFEDMLKTLNRIFKN